MFMSEPPILAELAGSSPFPGPPPGPKFSWGVVGCLASFFLLLVLLLSAGSFAVYQVIRIAHAQSAEEKAAAERQKTELVRQSAESPQRASELIAGFTADEVGITPEELKQLESLFEAARKLNDQPNDLAAQQRVFDSKTYAQRVLAWPDMSSLNYWERLALREGDETELLSWLSGKFHIVHVDKHQDGKSAIVYGYSDDAEQRWYLTFDGASWRLADLEPCDFGRWNSQMWAAQLRASYRDPASSEQFDKGLNLIDEAIELVNQQKFDHAKQKLSQVNLAGLDRNLQDELRLRRVYAYAHMPDTQVYLSAAQSFDNPDQWPGAHFAQARAHANLGQWEKAIDAAEKYKQRVGPSPGICRVLVEAHGALGNDERCAGAYRDLLRVNREDTASLAGLAATTDQATEVIGRLEALEKGAETAAQVIDHLDHDTHPEAVEALLGFIERKTPNSTTSLEAQASVAFRRDDYEQAAELALSAWRRHLADAEIAGRTAGIYFAAMLAAGKWQEAVEQAPDPQAALQFLASDYFYDGDYGVPKKALRAAVERLRSTHPNDPLVLLYGGKLLLEEKKYAQAEEALQALMTNFPDESDDIERGDVAGALAEALLHQDRVDEAYRAVQDTEHPVWMIVSRLDLETSSGRETARQLLELHRARSPADPWVALLEAELLSKEEKHRQAWDTLPKSLPPGDQALAYRCRNLQAELLGEGLVPIELYRAHADGDKIFAEVAGKIAGKKDWDRLDQLVAIEASARPNNEILPSWTGEALFQRGKYAEAVARLEPHAARLAEQSSFYGDGTGDGFDRLLRSLVRLGRHEDALRHAQQGRAGRGDPTWLVWINLARKNVPAAVEAVEAKSRGYFYAHRMYEDPEFGSLAKSPEAMSLRWKQPPPLPRFGDWNTVELLLSELPSWDDDAIARAARETFSGDAVVEPLENLKKPDSVQAWTISAAGSEYFVFVGSRSEKTDDEERWLPEEENLRKAVQDYQAWIVIAQHDSADSEQTSTDAGKLAVALAADRCRAMRFSAENNAVVFDGALREALLAGKGAEYVKERGEAYYFSFVYTSDEERLPPGFWRNWASFAKRLAKGEKFESQRVLAPQEFCGCTEEIWLRVEALQGPPGRYVELIVTPESPSVLAPQLKVGEPYSVSSYMLKDFEYTQDGVTYRGRP